jgi:hypothetical protein
MNLRQASGWFFKRSSRCLTVGLWLSVCLVGLTIAALRYHGALIDAALITVIATLQVIQMFLKYRSRYWFARGDEPRRMEQFRSGLGLPPSADRCAAIEQSTGPCNEPIRDDYWLSKKPAGNTRMVEMVLESSYSTRFYAQKCQNLFWLIGVGGFALSMIAIVVAYLLRNVTKTSDFISHVILAIFVFFLTGDFWIICAEYRDLMRAANDSHLQAFHLLEKTGNISEAEALETAMNYDTAVAQAPPLLSSLYHKHQPQVDEIFKRNFSMLLGIQVDIKKLAPGQV